MIALFPVHSMFFKIENVDWPGNKAKVTKGVATIEATEAAASVINSASNRNTTTLTVPRACGCHDKFVY